MTTQFLHEGALRLDNGIEAEVWQVDTANPENFYQAISKPDDAPATSIYAQNFFPPDVVNPAVVIVVPGSMGIAPSHVAKAELLTNAGIAACLIDPFGTRGVTSTVSNQAQFSFAASAWDVLATVDQLVEQGKVDSHRVGAQGHSRGGSAILSAATMLKFTSFKNQLVGVYAAYPWCGQQFLNPSVGTTKVRSIVGDQDEWCLPQQIQGHTHAINLSGGDASYRIIPGAHHSFDRATEVELVADASVSRSAPTTFIQDDGAFIHPVTGQADPQASDRDMMMYGIKAGYGVRGARLGTSEDFADIFHADMMAFWSNCLA